MLFIAVVFLLFGNLEAFDCSDRILCGDGVICYYGASCNCLDGYERRSVQCDTITGECPGYNINGWVCVPQGACFDDNEQWQFYSNSLTLKCNCIGDMSRDINGACNTSPIQYHTTMLDYIILEFFKLFKNNTNEKETLQSGLSTVAFSILFFMLITFLIGVHQQLKRNFINANVNQHFTNIAQLEPDIKNKM